MLSFFALFWTLYYNVAMMSCITKLSRIPVGKEKEEYDHSWLIAFGRREKLLLDCLAASGAATLSGSWARLFVNNEAFGLYLMIDDASTHFIDDVLHAGNYSYPYTGKSSNI